MSYCPYLSCCSILFFIFFFSHAVQNLHQLPLQSRTLPDLTCCSRRLGDSLCQGCLAAAHAVAARCASILPALNVSGLQLSHELLFRGSKAPQFHDKVSVSAHRLAILAFCSMHAWQALWLLTIIYNIYIYIIYYRYVYT